MELMDGDRRLALPEGYGTELGDLMASNSGVALAQDLDDPMATDTIADPSMTQTAAMSDPQLRNSPMNPGKPASVPDFIAKLFRYLSLLLASLHWLNSYIYVTEC